VLRSPVGTLMPAPADHEIERKIEELGFDRCASAA